MAKGLIDILLDSIFDENWKGRRGEKLTERELKLVRFFGRDGKILRNIYVPKDNGETSEIDIIYITSKGIFVMESKNYSGWIFGDEMSPYWTAMLPNRQKNKFYNPILQNKTHVRWLGKYLGEDIPLFSIIVFSERCELKKITLENDDVYVIKRDRTYATIRNIWDKSPDMLSDSQVDEIFDNLKKLTEVNKETKQKHIDDINEKYNRQTKPQILEKEIISEEDTNNVSGVAEKIENDNSDLEGREDREMICPRCGKALVRRTAKKGNNVGNQFYGCSGFPKCRYIIS